MSKVSKLLDEAVVATAKRELKKLGSYGMVAGKLRAVIAAHKYGIVEVARIYDISRTTLASWIKHIKALEINRLEAPKERCKPQKLNEKQMSEIRVQIESNPSITIKALKLEIESKYGIALSMATVHRVIQRLKFSHITPRPQHYKQDQNKVEEFKKKSRSEN